MHLRKASLDHRPASMIVCVGTSFRCIAMAAPLRRMAAQDVLLSNHCGRRSDLVNCSGGRYVF